MPDTNHEEVLFYFDLLWSIAPVLLNDPEAAGVRKIDGTMQTVGSLLADLRELEPVVKQLTPGDQASRRMIADRLKAYRSEENTSELQSLMRISYAVFCLKKNKIKQTPHRQ